MSSFFDFKRPQVPPKRVRDSSSSSSTKVLSDKENSLFVFGYACKIFDDKEKALHFDQGKHLIPWPGDESLTIDRYDARLYFSDKSQFLPKPGYEDKLSAEEAEEERMCDEERYMEMAQDMTEHEIEQEEEMKRFREVMSGDGYYNSVSFGYEINPCPDQNELQYEENTPIATKVDNTVGPIHHPTQLSATESQNVQQETQLQDEEEVFVPPAELEIPSEMEIPQTKKMHSIIVKTALFLSKHGAQMEIVLKAKQSGNPQFDFLSFGNWLNLYYRRVLSYIKEKKFIPETEPPTTDSSNPDKVEESSESDSEDDSDGEYDLHPLLTASLHRKPAKPHVQPFPIQPLPSSFKPTFTPETTPKPKEENQDTHVAQWPENIDNSQHHSWNSLDGIAMSGETDYVSSMPFPVSSMYDPYSAYMNMSYTTTPVGVSATQTASSMLPPPPPPPGEGPPEELGDVTSSTDVLPLPPPPPPPVLPLCPTMLMEQEVGAVLPTPSSISLIPENVAQAVPTLIVPPPPDLQPIVDKLAMYVARNGEDFESTVKAKNDTRFEFLNPWNAHYSYYQYKKQLCLQQVKKKAKSTDDEDSATDSPKGPISFSLKTKDSKKPKIEYRTSVIYKQSVGESDDEEEDDEASQEENSDKSTENSATDNQPAEKQVSKEEREIQEQQNLESQMNSIAAAQREAKRLEMESLRSGKNNTDEELPGSLRQETDQEKQIQLERRRRASLFISMLKNTTGNGVQEAVVPGEEKSHQEATSATKARTFSEIKRKSTMNNRDEETEPKKHRSSSPIFDIEDESPSGVGAPPPDSIKLTQDLMVKVLAARNKR